MNEERIIEERKRKLLELIQKDSPTRYFAYATGVSLLLSLVSALNLLNLPAIHFVILAVLCIGGTFLCAYGKKSAALYLLIIWPVWIATYIRTRGLPGLRDITTGGWTLGPDLDPFLFLRWAKDIIQNGHLMAIDTFRYVPLGFETSKELLLLPYMIAWFHKVAVLFGSTSVDQSAVLFPVFMFGITVVAVFLMTKELFRSLVGDRRALVISIIASVIVGILSPLLPRTIAGIPEKESAAFFFMAISFYFFLRAWRQEKKYPAFAYALLAALSTACMSLIWGGSIYVTLTIGFGFILAFLLYQVNTQRYLVYLIWFIVATLLFLMFSDRTSVLGLLTSVNSGIVILPMVAWPISVALERFRKHNFSNNRFLNLPAPLLSFVGATVLIIILAFILLGVSGVSSKLISLIDSFVKPLIDRLNVTVAENKQPYFVEWVTSFGPSIKGLYITFLIFILGTFYLFYKLVARLNFKDRVKIVAAFVIFILTFMLTRYSSGSLFNGENFLSLFVYIGGALLFLGSSLIIYIKSGEKIKEDFPQETFPILLALSFTFLCLLSVRSAVRLIMVLVFPVAITIAYIVVEAGSAYFNHRIHSPQIKIYSGIAFIVLVLLTLYASYYSYQESAATAQGYIPSSYTQQWQRAMAWVRESTPTDAVFSHWWDYGYWVQSIGNRATMLDGGNVITYWNYLVGRYVLTGSEDQVALNVLYAHNVSYFLVDSTDIGKYAAFASIGSNASYDRRSWINSFAIEPSRTVEGKNSSTYFYFGGAMLDKDIVYTINGTQIFLPGLNNGNMDSAQNLAGLGAVAITTYTNGSYSQPQGIFVYNQKQYSIPLRYIYRDKKTIDFGQGLDAGVFLMPSLSTDAQGGALIRKDGALLYLSPTTVHSFVARYYLAGQQSNSFALAHTEDDSIVASLKSQGYNESDFVYFQGVRGPIKIWNVKYPAGMTVDPEYVTVNFPARELQFV